MSERTTLDRPVRCQKTSAMCTTVADKARTAVRLFQTPGVPRELVAFCRALTARARLRFVRRPSVIEAGDAHAEGATTKASPCRKLWSLNTESKIRSHVLEPRPSPATVFASQRRANRRALRKTEVKGLRER